MKKAYVLIDGYRPDYVLADRAYDADGLMDPILDAGAEPVIPPRRHRRFQHKYDKLLQNFMGFVKIAAIAIWLK